MRKRGSKADTFLGGIILFFTVSAVVSVAVTVYALISEKTENKAVIATVMLSVIVFLSVLCTLIDFARRKITVERPVKKILAATDKIASGDFSVRLEVSHSYKRYDEYDYIIENLNAMAAELSKTEVLHTDFVSNISHEMKTPLAIIQNYAVALQNKNLDEQTRIDYAKTLANASKRLTALITNILKLNKLENQELKPENEEIDLAKMLAESVLGFEELIEEKDLLLECDFDEGIKVFSSPSYLEIIWNNLISNAIKFTDPKGKIAISLKSVRRKAVVRISDTGCGISAQTGKHIFEKFYQGDTSHSKEGNGLGLALVKRAIDIVGGEISVESEIGKGSAFTVILNEEER